MIVSSFIYVSSWWAIRCPTLDVLMMSQYYDSENISESKLSFRRATSEPFSGQVSGHGNAAHMEALYDMNMCVTHHQRFPNPVS